MTDKGAICCSIPRELCCGCCANKLIDELDKWAGQQFVDRNTELKPHARLK
jgi:hypothetical protein